MSSQLENKQRTLAQMLAANRLTKIASDQEIEHETPLDQTNLGKEQQEEIKDNVEGILASTPAAADAPKDTVETPPNCQNLNKDPQAALASTGTGIDTMKQDGTPTTFPKSASDYRIALAKLLKKASAKAEPAEQPAPAPEQPNYARALATLVKHANAKAQAQTQPQENPDFRTGMEVFEKFAALTPQSTDAERQHCADELVKLAATNPLFRVCRDRILMQKLAEDAEALAEAEGITPEEAADNLDAAAEADPSIMEEAEDEANGEALAELAGAEKDTEDMMAGAEQMAQNASEQFGVDVSADDILNAIDEVEAEAERQGVPPEALIQAAMEEMQGAEVGEEEVSPEEEAEAQQVLDQAAELGVSPEEVLQMAAENIDDGGEGGEDAAPTEAAPAEEEEEAPAEEGEEKTASVKTAGTKKTASVKTARTPRAAYVQQLMHRQ